MTVALGLVCSDGVLVASDSMGTSGDQTAAHTQKVRTFGRTPAIWTAAGSVYVIEEVDIELRRLDTSGTVESPLSVFTTPDPDGVRTKLKPAIHGAMAKAYASALNIAPAAPGSLIAVPFPADFLVLGYANSVPWFLEHDRNGQVNWHTDGGFYSVGSGGSYATVAKGLMSHYVESRPSLDRGKMIAYRAIETTISVSSQGVGMPVQMAVCDARGARLLGESELEEIATGVARWKQLERDTLLGDGLDEPATPLPSFG